MTAYSLTPKAGLRVAVAGGCGGMGRVFVREAISLGMNVAVIDLEKSLADFPPPKGTLAIACNAMDETSVAEAFAQLGKEWPALDALVNLVGFTNERTMIEAMSLSEWNEIVTGSLTSAFLLNRAALPLLRKGDERAIVNTSSTFGVRVDIPGFGPYAVAKAGIINLTRVLALECGPDVRVNALAPGLTDTAFLQGGTSRPEKKERTDTNMVANMLPLKRVGQPEDMTGPIMFLIGPGSRYMTAQTLHVNGGLWS